jgi:hypothetical protein
MKRRLLLGAALGGAMLGLAACSVVPQPPYVQRRAWPLVVQRPQPLPRRASGPVLLVRSVLAGPGLDVRGLQLLQPDGSVHVDFYEQWAVPPAEGVEASLREWLAGSGLFAAVLGPGSDVSASLVLEATLLALIAEPARQRARAALAIVLAERGTLANRVLLQAAITGTAPLASAEPPAQVAAERAALADAFRQIEQRVAAALPHPPAHR